MIGAKAAAKRLIRAQYAIADSHGGVWLGCACAAAVLRRTTPGETRPAEAVRLAQRWAQGEPIAVAALRAAASAARGGAAAAAAEAAAEGAVGRPASWAARAAWAAAETLPWAAAAATAAAAEAAAEGAVGRPASWASWAAEEAAAWAARAEPSTDLLALLRYEIESIEPTSADVDAARAEAAVIWDCYAVELGPARIGSLGDALSRARVLRLDWQQPVERALAERLPLEHPAWAALGVAS